ncbi:mucin-5B [Equus przewalskii]|uniref:Mucin-5B n=1 Tax=Equus przewalskii TaxID=9798 RepID=A0ABM4JXT8_EQUPR
MPAPGMGAPRGCRALAWALAALLLVQKAETQGGEELSWAGAEAAMDGQREAFAQQMIFIPPVTVFPTMSPVNPAHNGRVCSTWGDFHYKTFDGYVFRFPGLCNYVFSAHCGAAYEDFNIQLRRGLAGSKPTITHVVLKTQGLVLEISNGSILINGQQEELPYSRAGLLVEQSSVYVKVNVRLVLTFMWNGEDSALLELDPKYANQTCGLCGDFNGLPAINEFYAHNTRLTPLQFGNLQKLDGPTEQCQDPLPSPADNCTDEEGICRRTLLGLAFAQCHGLVDADVYVAACTQDLCRCPTCPCATFAEYSRQCTHAGGQPQNWRGPDLCPRTCPLNLQHQECGSPCTDTCSNPDHSQLCEDHCVDGCFCPPGTVLDDVSHAGCLPLEQCSCTHSGRTYAPGASFTTSCSSCTCSSGMWQCQDLPCPGTCSVQGGSHISTYDEKLYNVHGDCSYILSKTCADSGFTVLAELRQCGLTDNENCLKTVTLKMTSGGDTVIQIQANGGVFMNSIYTQLPVSAANITIFRPSSFFILVQTGLGLQLQVQLVPLMQVYLRLDPSYRGQMCGLCGNFNQNQADDFRILGGVVEGTAAAFANTWKTQAACPNVKNSFEDPCSLSVENENFAQHWCSLLTDPTGAFSPCHSIVNPAPFHSNCLFDTCNCEKSEACMCAALSSYVWACAAKGVLLHGWRDGVCTKYMSSCPKSQNYTYVVDSCQPTCRSLSQADVTCGIAFVPVDGCTCPSGTFLDDTSTCVPAEACPCYFRGSVVAPGEVVHDDGVVCSCVSGKLSCLGAEEQRSTGCVAPMLYLDCTNASAGTPGAECLRSCHVLDVDCFSTHCVSGCVCPPGLVSDGSGGCVAEEDCPCLHNEATYKPGETIRVDCNTCTCRNRRWECSHQPCLGTCVAYGDGHFITFDGERYSFEGSCEYTLVQDHCGGNGTANGTFRIVTENVPCGTTGVTCSKTIKLFLENYELILHEGTYKVVQRGPGRDLPYRIRYMGIYLTIETRSGMVVSWDRKTSVFIRLRQDYKGRVCGLCGNFDDNAINDFTTRSQSVVGNALEFGNSWKFSPSCPDAPAPKDPCTANPYRKSWAQKQCSIINSATFATCRSQVDSTKYYEACVSDACACNSGGDCECFCTAVAAYAQACRDVGVCVSWRSPDVCPLFCDYYNPHGECEWHYEPCGAPCLRTCRNPSGHCLVDLPGLEGCYPRCPPGRPFFSEDEMECVAQCGCYDEDGNYHEVGARVPAAENCQSCECTPNGIQCIHSLEACRCIYEGKTYGYEEVIYNTTDGLGACLLAICGNNGTIIRSVVECPGTLSTTPFTFTTTAAPPSTTGSAPTLSTVCVQKQCRWSDWYDSGRPEPDMGGGDFETFANLKQRGHQVCPAPVEIECRAQRLPNTPPQELGQKVECDLAQGLTCLNSEQSPPLCHNYELRVLCCDYVPCGTSPAPGTSSGPSPSVTAQVSTLKSLPTSTWTTPTRETPLQSTVASTSQTRPTVPATTAQTGSSSSTLAATTCQPKCQWTEWFDEDYPTSEKAGGDIESYDKIRSAGGAVCEQPQDIKCEAENFPTVRPEELGQRVHCHPSFGLVCRNQEQPGLFKMCYNYRIRVLCCSNSHCRGPASATTTATTAATATTTTATIATSTTTATNTSTKATVPTTTATATSTTTAATSAISTATTAATATTTATIATTTATATNTSTTATVPTTPATATSTTTTATTVISTATANIATTATTAITTTATATTATATSIATSATASTTRIATTASTTTITPASTSTTAMASTGTATTVPPATEPGTWLGSSPEVTTAVPFLSTGSTSRATSSNPSHTDTLLTSATSSPRSPPGSTKPTTPGGATSVLPTRTTLQGTTEGTSQGSTSRPRLPTEAPTSTTRTVSTSPPSTSHTRTSTLRTETPKVTLVPTAVTETTTSQGTTSCQPKCEWTEWFDVDFPTSGVTGGDMETYENIRAAGGRMCAEPQKIECRAENYPEVSLDQIGQVLSCSLEAGLVCRNEDQQGRFNMCFNYNIRVLCCDDRSHCPSTAAPSPSSTATGFPTSEGPGRSTSATTQTRLPSPTTQRTTARQASSTAHLQTSHIGTTTGSPPIRPTSATTLLSSPSQPGSVTSTPTVSSTEACKCAWTRWFDKDYPTPGHAGGDFETYANIRAAGEDICEQPLHLECRAEMWPDVPVQELGQVVQCDVSVGLVCRNRDQSGPIKLCLNYHIRVFCCDYSHCPGTPATTTATPPATSPGLTSLTATGTTARPPTTPSPTSPNTHPTTATSGCQPACHWTEWLDSDWPKPGPYGGDSETYHHILRAGGQLCSEPVAIECQAVLFPEVPFRQLGQVVKCDVDYGLICRNKWQSGGKTCLNYHIRVRCCDDYSHCASSAVPADHHTVPQTLHDQRQHGQAVIWSVKSLEHSHDPGVPLLSRDHRDNSPLRTTEVTVPTSETGPSSHMTTHSVPTTQTPFTSLRTTETPFTSLRTTEVTVPTSETGPSSRTTTHSVPTTQTPFTSLSTTEKVTVPTTETGPSSPRRTPSVSTTQTTFTSLSSTKKVTVPTTERGLSSSRATPIVPTTQTHLTSLRTSEKLTVPTTETGPSSPRPTELTISTTETGPSSSGPTPSVLTAQTSLTSFGSTERVTFPTSQSSSFSPSTTELTVISTETGPSSRTTIHSVPTTQTPFTSLSTTEKVTVPPTETGPSSSGPTPSVLTAQTSLTSLRTSEKVTVPTTETGPSSPRRTPSVSTTQTTFTSLSSTKKVTVPTTERGLSSSGATPIVPTTQTHLTSLRTSEKLTVPTTETGPSSPRPTELTISTTETGPSSSGPTPSVLTAQTSLTSFGSTERVTFPTSQSSSFSPSTTELTVTSTETGPSSRTTIHSVPTTQTPFTSLSTTEKVTVPPTETGPSSSGPTPSVLTAQTSLTSLRTSEKVTVPTTETGPSSPRRTPSVSTTQTTFTSLSSTKKVTVPTTERGLSSSGATPIVPTTQTHLTSLRTSEKLTVPTTETGPSSPRPTELTITTTETGPSSPGPTPSVLTAQTSLTSFGSTERVTFPTSQSSSFSPSTTELTVTSTETGPSSRTTIHSVPTTQTPLTSLSTTEKVTVPTTETGPSSPRRTPSVSTTQTPFTSLRTTEVTVPTSETGPSSRMTTHSVPTTQTPFTSLRTTEVTVPTSETGPSSRTTTHSVPTTKTPFTSLRTTEVTVPTSETGPSSRTTTHSVPTTQTPFTSLSTTEKVTVPTPETGPSSPRRTPSVSTTQTTFTSLSSTKKVTVPTTERGLSSSRATPIVPTTQTHLTSLRTSEKLTVPTTKTGLSSSRPTEVTISTTETGPSSPGPTPSVLTTQTSLPSFGSTERVTFPTSQSSPFSPSTTELTVTSTETAPSSRTTIHSVPTTQTPFTSLRTTEVTVPTSETGRSSHTTTHSVPTTQTPFTSLRTTEVTVPTSETGPSSRTTTHSVPTTQTPFTSLSTTEKVTVPTTETGPSSPRRTPSVSTTQTTFTSLSSTKKVTVPTTERGLSSSGATPIVPTTQTHLTSLRTSEKLTVPTTETGPSSPRPTELTISTTETGPSSSGPTPSVLTAQTSLTSFGSTERVTFPTSQSSSFSPSTTELTVTSTETAPSSRTTIHSVPTTQTPFTSLSTTEKVTVPTTETGPSSPRRTPSVSTTQTPFISLRTTEATVPTSETGPSSRTTTHSVPTTQTPFTSLRTTEVTVPTSETGPSSRTTTHSVPTTQTPFTSLRTTEVTVPTSETGPSSRTTTHSVPTTQAPFTSLRTTKQVTVPTTKTGLSSSTPTEVTISTTETGPSSPGPTPSVLTTQTPFTSLWTTEKVTVPTSPTSLMSPVTTEITVPPTETHPSSPATMQRLSIPTTEIVPSSPRTTQSVSISSPSASPGTLPTTTRPAPPSAPPTARIITTPWSPPSGPTSATTLLSSPSQPSSMTHTPTASSTEVCKPQCAWTRWFDEDYPTPGHAGGDFETYANIRAAGEDICEQPLHLECRAEMWPDVPVQELGQVVQCDVSVGLVCRNRDQSGPIKLCLNYHIRVFCCDYSHCPGTPATTTVTPPATSPGLTSLTATGTTARPPTTPSPTSPNKHPTTATSGCQPACHWTEWLDSDRPKPGPYGGDTETYYHILRTGGQLCSEPVAIECQAVLFPEVPFRQLGQVVKCDVDYGLICRNKWQSGGETCLNYHIRVRCCDDYSHCTSSAVPETTTLSPRPSTTSASTGRQSSGVSRVWSTATTQVYLSSPGTSERVSITPTETGPPSPRTSERLSIHTSQTGPSSPWTTGRVSISSSSASSRTQTTTATPGLPSAPPSSPLVTSHMWTTAAISSSLPHFSVSTASPSILTTPGPTAFPSPLISTTACLCRAFGQLFSPGDVIYNKTDSAGCQFYAICNQRCDIDRFQGSCPTSSPPETSVTLTSQVPGCDLIDPPRQVNESWTLANCTVARCEGENHIVLLEPKPVANITCVNGHLPVKVWSKNERCTYHLECECSCSGWGHSHYKTFDGTSYSFGDNCTHVLMREIRPLYGNLSIYINNYYCGATAATTHCPRALIIHYKSMEIILTTTTGTDGQEQSLILFDQRRVSEVFSKNGVNVSVTGTTMMHIDISAILVRISFDGHIFQARLSYSHFSHNTEGLCGTCTNSQTDDCRRPDGTMAPTCKDMASSWLVPDSSKEGCQAPPPTTSPLPHTPTTPTSPPCAPAPFCKLLLSQVFAECHSLIPPGPFFSTCVSDGCQTSHPNVSCQSLEAYAALCHARGVCSNWRNATAGLCELTCPPTKVYKSCGPVQPEACNSRSQSPVRKGLAEGCFCPDGHILFNSYTDICVPQCPCVGPDGFPKFPGERWVSNCQACVCDEDSVSVQCVPVQCKAQDQPLECGRAGFLTITRPLADNPCCQETLCICNVTTCPQSPLTCGPGLELTLTQREGDCCPTFLCKPKLCTYNGTFYGVGATFPGVTPCHKCACLSVDTGNLTVQCEENTCNTTCPQGFEYSEVAGQCCGECVQTACLTPSGGLVQPNETWVNSPVDNCTEYHCQAENGLLVLTPRPVSCPIVSSCRGVLQKRGCCYSCEEDSCRVRVQRKALRLGDCVSPALVNVPFCEGSCLGVSVYSLEAQAMQHECTCCQEKRAHQEVVTLQCPDGTTIQYTYIHVDACSCTPGCAPSPEAPEDSTPILLL